MDLAELLEPGSWEFCIDPFPHVRAERVFTVDFHRELATAFDTILRGQQWPAWPEARFRRNMPGYDASAADLNGRVGWPFNVFVSRPWHDLFARHVRHVHEPLHGRRLASSRTRQQRWLSAQ